MISSARSALSVLAIGFFALSIGGCAAQTDDSSDDTSDSDITGSALAGTYDNSADENNDLPFYSISFKSDHTYTATGGCRSDGPGPHCNAITAFTGKWSSKKSGPQLGAPGGASTLVLTDSLANKNTYFFSLLAGELDLSETYRGTASVFRKHQDAPAGPNGTFTVPASAANSLPFYAITFDKDGTFQATGGCRPASTTGIAACHAISHMSGSWNTAISGPQLGSPQGAAEIQMVDSFDQPSKYFFTLSGKKLSLSETYGGEAVEFDSK